VLFGPLKSFEQPRQPASAPRRVERERHLQHGPDAPERRKAHHLDVATLAWRHRRPVHARQLRHVHLALAAVTAHRPERPADVQVVHRGR
jgi:hypothetical protein